MHILSHRGYWKTSEEKNTEIAFRRSFELGFGTETDVRDCAGKLLISHDPPQGGEVTVEEMLAYYRDANGSFPLALNIKADGLQTPLAEALQRHGVENYFLFDMSVPDALITARNGLRFFTRQSELEPEPALYDKAAGVWMDMFFGNWVRESDITKHLATGKQVCLVSPDLHKRPHLPFWELVSTWKCHANPNLLLCTDHPEEARAQLT
jgi:glycerophosphoryl diester phosphodiesterase